MSPRIAPLAALAQGSLHRAYVSLPALLCGRDQPLQERTVFFEVPHTAGDACVYLEKLLAAAWCTETSLWGEHGFIYNIYSARDLLRDNEAEPTQGLASDLALLECAWGGPDGIGPRYVHYSRAADVDLFVTPRVHKRLSAALAEVERLCAAKIEAVPA